MEKRSSEGFSAAGGEGAPRVQGTAWRATCGRNMGVEAPGTEQGSESPRGQREMEAGGVGLLVAVSVQVSAHKSHFSGWPRAHAGHLHASCRVGTVGAGLQMCLGLVWCSLQRVRQGRSSSAGRGRVGQLARGGRWLAGVRSSARCRWSRGEAGSWRGIWLSCWRCMRAVGTRAQ